MADPRYNAPDVHIALETLFSSGTPENEQDQTYCVLGIATVKFEDE
jgi:hypothetical protein